MRLYPRISSRTLAVLKEPLLSYWDRQAATVRVNEQYKDIHRGETCLIFGNGASLKFYNFAAIPSLTAIGCSFSLIDKRMKRLNVKYNVLSDSYIFYPLIYNDYVDSVQRNPMRHVFKRMIREHPETTFFTSITNSFGFVTTPPNVRYWHHFRKRDSSSVDLAGQFSTCTCAMDMMLGVARYLGFARALLLGCDYLTTPKMEGHFYADRRPVFGKDNPGYAARIQKSVGDLDILVICPRGVSSPYFPSVTFEEHFRAPEVYQSNRDIIDPEDFKLMQRTADAKLIFV